MSTIAVKKVKLGDNADLSKNFLIEVPAVADGTLTIKRENGTSVLSIDATGKAVIPGVVGTVAQVGGIPSGQVVERGSNANGEYVRFADGTQICTKTVSANTAISDPWGSTYISSSISFGTWAAGFVTVPNWAVEQVASDDVAAVMGGAPPVTGTVAGAVVLYRGTSAPTRLRTLTVTGIGRWF